MDTIHWIGLKHIKMKCNVDVTHSSIDTINYTIEHILQFINSDGGCARCGGLPGPHEQAAVGGPSGRGPLFKTM